MRELIEYVLLPFDIVQTHCCLLDCCFRRMAVTRMFIRPSKAQLMLGFGPNAYGCPDTFNMARCNPERSNARDRTILTDDDYR